MSAPVKTPDPEGSKPEKPTSFLGVIVGWALAAVPAVAGTIGFLGFVAVIGAAIQWTRFESAKLPADQAVHAIPQRELVAIGAVSLIAFTVLGLLAVLLAFIVDRRGDPSRSTRKALVFIALLEGLVVILLVWPPRVQALAAGVWMVAFAVASMLALRWLVTAWVDDGRRSEADHELERLGLERAHAQEKFETARDRWRALAREQRDDVETQAWHHAEFEMRFAQRRFESRSARWLAVLGTRPLKSWLGMVRQSVLEHATDDRAVERTAYIRGRRRVYLGVAVSVGLLCAGAVVVALVEDSEPYWLLVVALVPVPLFFLRGGIGPALGLIAVGAAASFEDETAQFLGILVLVAIVLGVGNLMVARATQRFVWYGIAVFFSVALFGGVFAAARSIRSPKVQPAALVRKGSDRGVCGIYITETDSRVYLGRVEKEAGTGDNAVAGAGRVFWIPKNDVEMLSIGPLQGIDRATARAPVLLAELYADRPEEPGRTAKPTTETVAVERTRTSGSDSVKQTRTTTEEQPVVRDRPADRPASEETTCTDQELAGVGG